MVSPFLTFMKVIPRSLTSYLIDVFILGTYFVMPISMELEKNSLLQKSSPLSPAREKFSFTLPKETSALSRHNDSTDERQLSFEDLFNNSSIDDKILAQIPTVEVLNKNIFLSPPRFKRYLTGSILLHSLLILFVIKAEMELLPKDEKKELIPISVSFEGSSPAYKPLASAVDSSIPAMEDDSTSDSVSPTAINSVTNVPAVKNHLETTPLKVIPHPSKIISRDSKVSIKKSLPHKSTVSASTVPNVNPDLKNDTENLKTENLSLADIKEPELNSSLVDEATPIAAHKVLEDLNQDLDTLEKSDDSHINNTEKEISDLSEANLKDINEKSSALNEDLAQLDSVANERIQKLQNEKAALAQARQNELAKQAQILAQKQKAAKSLSSGNGSAMNSGNGSGENGNGSGSQGRQEQIRKLEDLRQAPGNIKPQYSDEERLQEISGTVIFNGFVSKEGRLTEFKLVKSSGHRSLDAKTLQALKKWKFYPGQEGWVELPFKWDLKGEVSQKPTLLKRK